MGLHLKCIIIVLIFGYVYTSIKGLPLSLSNIGLLVPSPNTSQNTSPQGMQKNQINSFHGNNFYFSFRLSSMLWYLALWATLILLVMLVPKSAEIITPWIINRAETFLKNVILWHFIIINSWNDMKASQSIWKHFYKNMIRFYGCISHDFIFWSSVNDVKECCTTLDNCHLCSHLPPILSILRNCQLKAKFLHKLILTSTSDTSD